MGMIENSALRTFLVVVLSLVLRYRIVLVIDYRSICLQKDISKL